MCGNSFHTEAMFVHTFFIFVTECSYLSHFFHISRDGLVTSLLINLTINLHNIYINQVSACLLIWCFSYMVLSLPCDPGKLASPGASVARMNSISIEKPDADAIRCNSFKLMFFRANRLFNSCGINPAAAAACVMLILYFFRASRKAVFSCLLSV